MIKWILLIIIVIAGAFYVTQTDHGKCHVLKDNVACAKQGANDLLNDIKK